MREKVVMGWINGTRIQRPTPSSSLPCSCGKLGFRNQAYRLQFSANGHLAERGKQVLDAWWNGSSQLIINELASVG
jgi:hypothetical protein